MKILHILSDGPSATAEKVIDVQSREHQVELVDLSVKEKEYKEIIDKIFKCDKVMSW